MKHETGDRAPGCNSRERKVGKKKVIFKISNYKKNDLT